MTLYDLLEKPLRYFLFGGKGGVGKTSCAAATSIYFADHEYETLIISTDPAHSLSDSFNQNLSGGEIIPVSGVSKLYAQEINPQKLMKEMQEKMQVQDEMAQIMPMMTDTDMIFPGMDEAIAFTKVLELMQNSEYDIVVFDTAPTGHTLRLLSLPDVMDSVIGKLIRFQLWIKNSLSFVKRIFGRDAPEDKSLEQLKNMQQVIRDARKILSDHNVTRFIPVLIPTMMAIEETERLLSVLYTYDIPVDHMVVNMVLPEDAKECKYFASRYKIEQENLEHIKYLYAEDFDITIVPHFDGEIRGIESLRKLAKILFEQKKTP